MINELKIIILFSRFISKICDPVNFFKKLKEEKDLFFLKLDNPIKEQATELLKKVTTSSQKRKRNGKDRYFEGDSLKRFP